MGILFFQKNITDTMPQNLTITVLVGCPFTLRVLMTAWCLDMKPNVKWVHSKWQLKTEDYMRRNHEGISGLMETEFGMLTDSEAAMRYLARLDTKQNLAGRTNFERAQVDMLVADVKRSCMAILKNRGMEKGAVAGESQDLMTAYNQTPMAMKSLEDRLGKGAYLLGDHMTLADICLLAFLWHNRGCTLPATVMKRLPNMQKWFNMMTQKSWFTRLFGKSFAIAKPLTVADAKEVTAFLNDKANDPVNIARAKQGLPEPKQPEAKQAQPGSPKKLTGKAAAQAKMAAEKAKKEEQAALGPKKKGPVIAKSVVVFDVKGYEEGQDFEALAKKIRAEVNMDGLVWMDQHKVLPIAFGMKKLQITMLIEDEKVQTDDVFELIEAWEDDVQSTDIVSF